MTGQKLTQYRKQKGLTQDKAAQLLGVSQTYLSLLENGDRPVTAELKRKVVVEFDLKFTELPAEMSSYRVTNTSDEQLTADLAGLGYKGFSHYNPSYGKNPADVLLSALNSNNRDARLVEALPWLIFAFPDMNWHDLTRVAKLHDLQNRLGFVVSVARGLAEQRDLKTTVAKLKRREAELEPSMLAREDTLCNESMTNAERRWLDTNRSDDAKHWRILASLSPHLVRYAD